MCRDYFINHESPLNNQNSIESKAVFFLRGFCLLVTLQEIRKRVRTSPIFFMGGKIIDSKELAVVGDMLVSKVVSTHLWNTPLNLYQQAIKGFLSKLARGIAWGVLWGCVAIFLDSSLEGRNNLG